MRRPTAYRQGRQSKKPSMSRQLRALARRRSPRSAIQSMARKAVPLRLGRYQIVRLLGEGSFGSVYLARDGELDRDVAIKVPTTRALAMPGQLEALLAEARLAAGLRHPAIVGVYDVGRDDDGTVFVVLEYVEGTTLSDLLRQGRVDAVRLAGLIANIADAVHHAHTAGLVHRDLKPANIMIDEQGKPRVADFGLAITEAMQTDRAGEVAGTPTYYGTRASARRGPSP